MQKPTLLGIVTRSPMAPPDGEIHLIEDQLAAREQVSVRTAQRWRTTGEGPPYIKVGKAVRYRLQDVKEWEEARVRQSTSEHGNGR
jgi:predicted DNA-binding transcriptional regulator AlpA